LGEECRNPLRYIWQIILRTLRQSDVPADRRKLSDLSLRWKDQAEDRLQDEGRDGREHL